MTQDGTRRGARGPGMTLTVTPQVTNLRPGDRVELRLVVASTDHNDLPTRYHLGVMGLQRLWYTLDKTDILLEPGAQETVALVLHPTPDTAVPGRYPFRVKATWPANPSVGASAVAALTVTPAAAPGDAPPDLSTVAATPLEPPPQLAARPTAALSGQPPEQLRDAPAERPAPAGRWTTAAGPTRRRRIPLIVGLGVLLILLLGEGAVLASRLGAPRPASDHAATPAVTPTAPILQVQGGPRRTPYGSVAGAVARTPVIRRFAVIHSGPNRSTTLIWQTENAAVVTINGAAAPPRGTRVIQPSVYGSVYSLRARTGNHVATASVHAVAVNPVAVAASVPVALLNLTTLRFPDRSLGATTRIQTIRLVNLGPVPLTIARIAVNGDRADFTVRATCARRTLPVDASCAIDVRFAPTRRGARHAILAIVDNTATGSERVLLDGAGV